MTDELAIVYVAEGLAQGAQELDSTEEGLQVHRLRFSDAVAWTLAGDVTDAITVAAILRLAIERGESASPAGGFR